MAATPPPQPPPDSSGIRIGDVGGSVNFSALGDIVGGDKITTITTTIQISVEAVTQRPLVTASPYRGLDRFEDRDKDLFFGRDQLIKSLLAQLSASNVLLVLGASGSGKSSVVRAGLLPQLSQLIGARFRYFTFVPDVNPFESLRSALHGAGFSQTQTRELADAQPGTATKLVHTLQREGDQWILFVDQFEEIFTVGDEKLRTSFIAALVEIAQDANSSTKLVLAMRADFLDRFSPFPQFVKIIEKNIDFVADMHADELRQAIEQPAARHGVVFEQGLVEEIIKDVQGQAGSLPLLQYTLDLLWREETRADGFVDRHLNTKAYRELGGVRGALQKRADEIYASFADGTDAKAATQKQEIVRQIFLRLVDLAGEGSSDAAWRPVRRRASMTMFTAAQEQEILQSLINQKLLVSNREGDDATVEVAHEALFTSWGRLKNWIEAGKQVIFARNRLADDARRWQRRQQEGDSGADEELLAGSRLSQALDMRARNDFNTVIGGLGETEAQFLDASAALRDRRRQEEHERQQRELAQAQTLAEEQRKRADEQARSAVRLRRFVFALGVVFALAVAAAVWAWAKQTQAKAAQERAEDATKIAREQTQLAEERRRVASARQLETFARTELDDSGGGLLRSVLLSVESLKSAWTREGHLIWGKGMSLLSHRPITLQSRDKAGKKTIAVAISPNGRWLASEDQDAIVSIWDVDSATLISRDAKPSHQFSPTRPAQMQFAGLAFSADSAWLASGARGEVRVWDTSNWNLLKSLEDGEMVWSVAFSPDRRFLATASYHSKQARLYDTSKWSQVPLAGAQDVEDVRAVTFSPDSRLLLAAGSGIRTWGVTPESGVQTTSLFPDSETFGAETIVFSNNGQCLAAGRSGGVQVWQRPTGDGESGEAQWEKFSWRAHNSMGRGMAFSSDGRYLATAGTDGTARLWEKSLSGIAHWGGDNMPRELTRMVQNARSVAFSPDDTWLVTANEDNTISRWPLVNGQEVTRLRHGDRVNAVAFSPDGQWLVSGSDDSTVRVIKVGNFDDWNIVIEKKTEAPVSDLIFSPDGRRLFAASGNLLKAYEPAANWSELPPVPHQEIISALRLSLDGFWIVTLSGKTIRVFDCATFRLVGTINEENTVDQFGFSPDRKWLVTLTHRPTVKHVAPPKITRIWDMQNFQPAAFEQTGDDNATAEEKSKSDPAALTATQKALLLDSSSWQGVLKRRLQSPDRRWGVNSGTLLEASSGREVNTFAHDDAVRDRAFSPDSRWLATASADHTVRIWALKTEDLIKQACARLPRNLSQKEWTTYMGNEPYSTTCPNLPVPNE
jgi:WD40 repeat protein